MSTPQNHRTATEAQRDLDEESLCLCGISATQHGGSANLGGGGCQFLGQQAIYRGPYKAVLDEAGHLSPRNVAVEVCTDTAAKLSQPPYAGWFIIVEPDGSQRELVVAACCLPGSGGAGCC